MSLRALKLTVIAICFCVYGNAQNVITKNVEVSFDKTTFVMFDTEVDFFDVGSEEVLFSVTEKPNIVKIKASVENFNETNITIITKGGKYYSLIVTYNNNPEVLNYIFTETGKPVLNIVASETANEDKIIEKTTEDIDYVYKQTAKMTDFNSVSNIEHKIGVALTGVYVYKGNLFFRLSFTNQSPIDYKMDGLMFSVQPKKKSKKATTTQDVSFQPIATKNAFTTLKAGEELADVYYVFKSFAINDKSVFVIDALEADNSVRNVSLKISNSSLLQAKIIK